MTAPFGRVAFGADDVFVEVHQDHLVTFADLPNWGTALSIPLAELQQRLANPMTSDIATSAFLTPLGCETEVWGAGVTFTPAHSSLEGPRSVYTDIFYGERPQLFFKSTIWRAVGDGANIGVRSDSDSSMPEPEIAFVFNAFQELVGITLANDVTAVSIEAKNPLHHNQAKIYTGSLALGPVVMPAWALPDLNEIDINGRLVREGVEVWAGRTTLSTMCRSVNELRDALFRCQAFPQGVVLCGGAGIWPPETLSLLEGDVVTIWSDVVGSLSNPVTRIA